MMMMAAWGWAEKRHGQLMAGIEGMDMGRNEEVYPT